jgi:hypothetical protein
VWSALYFSSLTFLSIEKEIIKPIEINIAAKKFDQSNPDTKNVTDRQEFL